MATFSSLPDEVLLHIVGALFRKLKINIVNPRPLEILRKKRHRRNILCITAVNHKLRSIALDILEENRDDVEYSLNDVRKIIRARCDKKFFELPFSANLVNLTIPPTELRSLLYYLHHDCKEMGHIIPSLGKTFPRLSRVIIKSEGSDLLGFIDKDEDAIGLQQRYKQTNFVVDMVQTLDCFDIIQQCWFIHSTRKGGKIQLVLDITFKWMGQTVSSWKMLLRSCHILTCSQECTLTATNETFDVRSFGYAPACIWAKELAEVLGVKLPAVYVEQDKLYRQSLVEGGSSGLVVTQR